MKRLGTIDFFSKISAKRRGVINQLQKDIQKCYGFGNFNGKYLLLGLANAQMFGQFTARGEILSSNR